MITRNFLAISLLMIALTFSVFGMRVSHAQSGEAFTPSFTLGSGDVINVFVWKYPELSRQVLVRPDGKISYPLIGELSVEGKDILSVEKLIRDGLKRHIKSPQINVGLESLNSYGVYVLGEVLRPGYFRFHGSLSVVQTIANAGGFTPYAYRKLILIVRKTGRDDQRIAFDYEAFLGGAEDVSLRPGDTVIIESDKKLLSPSSNRSGSRKKPARQ